MLNRKIIKAVSITQDNDQSCNGNFTTNSKHLRRTADKKRRQFLKKELRKELE